MTMLLYLEYSCLYMHISNFSGYRYYDVSHAYICIYSASLNIDIMMLSFYSVKLGKNTACIIFENEISWRAKSFTQSIPQAPHKSIHFHDEKVKSNEAS